MGEGGLYLADTWHGPTPLSFPYTCKCMFASMEVIKWVGEF